MTGRLGRWLDALLAAAGVKLAAGLAGVLFVRADPRPLPFPAWIQLAVMAAFAVSGAILVAGGRRDRRAVLFGAQLVAFASVFADRPIGRLASLATPSAAGAFDGLLALRPDAFVPALLWVFARDFPRSATFGAARRIPAVAISVALGAGAALATATLASALARGAGAAVPVPLAVLDRWGAPSVYWEPLVLLALSALPFIVWQARRAPIGERRRVRLFVTGLVVGSAPMLVDVLLEAFVPPFAEWVSEPGRRWASGLLLYALLLVVPVATAYAVLVEQALDVRLVVRKALQYALVRYVTVAMLGVPFVAAAGYVYWHRTSSVAELLTGGGLAVLAATGAAAWAVWRSGRRLFDAIDRRYFREQYDARQILAGIVERSRRAGSVDALGALVVGEIDRALHVETVALLVAEPARRALVACGGRVPPLSQDAALAVLVGGRPEPLVVDLAEGALARLPEREREWLADGAFRLLVPLIASEGRLAGLLALGDKKSELPFSREDQRLLAEVAASAALVLENLQVRTAPAGPPLPGRAAVAGADAEEAADECVACHELQPAGERACRVCGGELERAPVPVVLAGKFRLECRVGGGGMGVVYRARDLALDRLVAIKTLPRVSPDYARQLRQEARAIAALSHANLALIFGAEAWRGTPMLILEYLEGGTLADRLRRGALAPAETVGIGAAMADALARVHEAGILHRDVKPSNIGFTKGAVPKLLDFGVAKIVDDSMRAGAVRLPADAAAPASATTATWLGTPIDGANEPTPVVGTPLYLSPEAIRAEPPDPSFDLWALALVLYEAIAGRHPFARASLFEALGQIARADVPDVRTFAPACPPALAAFLAGALAPDRTRRPASAREFRATLERLRLEPPGADAERDREAHPSWRLP